MSYTDSNHSQSAQELRLRQRVGSGEGSMDNGSNGNVNLMNGYRRQSSSGSGGGLQKSESYRGQTQAWWSIDEHMKPRGLLMSSHQKLGMSLAARIFNQQYSPEDSWDLSDSLADLYLQHDIISKKSWSSLATFKPPSNLEDIDREKWLAADTSHGFIRVYPPDSTAISEVGAKVIPCSLAMEAHSICQAIGVAPNSLHVQFGGDLIRRLDPYEHPLVLQNEYLSKIGYQDVYRIQLEGLSVDLGYLIRFYSGKPFFDNTFSRNHLSAYLDVKMGGVLSRWCKRLCTIAGTQLKIYKDKSDNGTAQVIQLSNGSVEECKSKTHPHYIKLTTLCSGPEKIIFLSFETFTDYSKWLKKCKKAVAKLPANADLSNCNLEFLPETLFINGQLTMLNLRHNALRHRPTEEDIYTIGWLEDLPRFQCLRSLNLADNNLETFPISICEMNGLAELNLGCNKMESIPTAIGNLLNLQALHLHNNHLSSMPTEILQLKKLVILVLAFNRFHQIPPSVAQLTDVRSSECETIIMAGNLIDSISSEVITKLRHAKKVDLRMNNLTLPASETVHMSIMEQLTHLDLRMNNIKELDLRCLKLLEYLNVERNDLHTLQLNGGQLKTVFAGYNAIQQFLVNPKPEWLEIIDLSYNKLEKLPEWMSDCSFLKRLNVSHNKLQTLPQRLFSDAQKLKQLIADHNEIRELPSDISNSIVEEINLHHNLIALLPDHFLSKLNKLRILNLSSNALTFLPPLNEIDDLNKLHELYLTQNSLQDDCLEIIAGYRRLRILHLAYNELTHVSDIFVESLELLQELNISGNRMKSLPRNIVNMPELRLLRAHSNLLRALPDLTDSSTLKVLDVACNKLLSISASELASSSQLHSLDMQMTQFSIDKTQMEVAKKTKQIKSIDSSGENKELSSTLGSNSSLYKIPRICQLGFAETSGTRNKMVDLGWSETTGQRNKLCITVLHQMSYKDQDEALFAMFDGGRNSEVPKLLKKIFPNILAEEIEMCDKPNIYLKYSFLQAHKCLKNAGQYLGSSAVVCHIRRNEEDNRKFYINLANCGDIVAVLCRAGEPLVLTQSHTVVDDREEASRIFRSDGIVTEDNRVNGTSITSRALGNCYLYPQLVPEPYILKKTLRPEDQFLIIANSSLWRYMSYKEAIEEIQYIANPVVAAKRLQDLAQGYGCKENVSVLVVQFNCNLLSSATSTSNLSAGSEGVIFHTLPSNKDSSKQQRKRPIPAPRSLTPKVADSNGSLNATVNFSYGNIVEEPNEKDEASQDAAESSSLSGATPWETHRKRIHGVHHKPRRQPRPSPRQSPNQSTVVIAEGDLVSAPPDLTGWQSSIDGSQILMHDSQSTMTDSQAWYYMNGGDIPTHTGSNSTLTHSNPSVDGLEYFDNQIAKLPLYSSDTRLLEFVGSTSTLNSVNVDSGEYVHHQGLSYPKNPLHQSDSRLLHPSQIELRSTNYFTRPALSCSSVDEELESDYGDYLFAPPSDYSNDASSQSTIASSNGRPKARLSRRTRLHISGQSLQSPDGSYFSIDSDDEDDDDFNIYENIAALRLTTSRSSRDSTPTNSNTNLSDQPVATTYSNQGQTFYQGQEPASLSSSSDISKSSYRSTNRQHHPSRPSKSVLGITTNNNIHHISNGSSAYGSGSLAVSRESDIDTFL